MIVARPYRIRLHLWDGRKFYEKPIDTGDIAYASNQPGTGALPDHVGLYEIRSTVFFHADSGKDPIYVRERIDDIFAALAPRYEPEPVKDITPIVHR